MCPIPWSLQRSADFALTNDLLVSEIAPRGKRAGENRREMGNSLVTQD